MPWLQLRLTVPRDQAEALGEALEAFGAQAVTMQGASSDSLFDQIDETPSLWASTNLTALFDADDDIDVVIAGVRSRIEPIALPPHEVSVLADQDWNRAWMDRFQPMRFGNRLWVVPSWHQPPQPEAVNLVLDPGMAFGTGTHPTTSLCLQWLDAADLRGKRVLDFGCGSGILAIAAIRLGAASATAVDIDPQCLEVTRENAERNRTLDRMQIEMASAALVGPFDVLVANILAGPLHQLADTFAIYLRPGGDIVLSGLLAPQAEDCLATYTREFAMEAPRLEGDWAYAARDAPRIADITDTSDPPIMITRCPGCRTAFRISVEHLRPAHGQVQCGICSQQFDAIEHLLEDNEFEMPTAPPATAPTEQTLHEAPAAPPTGEKVKARASARPALQIGHLDAGRRER